MENKNFFPGIGKIKFEGKKAKILSLFRYYDAEKVYGRKMKIGSNFRWPTGIHCVPKVPIRLVDRQKFFRGTKGQIR